MANVLINRWHALKFKQDLHLTFSMKIASFLRQNTYFSVKIIRIPMKMCIISVETRSADSTISSCTDEKHQPPRIHVQQRRSIPPDGLYSVNIVVTPAIRTICSINFFCCNFSLFNGITNLRSLSNLHSQKSRSMKSVKIPWYEKPILKNNKYFNIQRGSMLAGLFAFVSDFCVYFLTATRLQRHFMENIDFLKYFFGFGL